MFDADAVRERHTENIALTGAENPGYPGELHFIGIKLGSNLAIGYTHVFDEVNITFPEVIDGTALNITVNDMEITVTLMATDSDYNAGLLEEHLIAFLQEKAG